MKALEGRVDEDQRRDSTSSISRSTGSSQSPEQFPEGQREAPRAEHFPAQLAPSPHVTSSDVVFWWQQVTFAVLFKKVNTLSKKSIELDTRSPEGSIFNYSLLCHLEYLKLKGMRPSELEGFWSTGRFSGKHGAVSVGSPSHSEAERARQWRALNFLQREHDGSHSVHSPHSSH